MIILFSFCYDCHSNINYCTSYIKGTKKEGRRGNCRFPSEVNIDIILKIIICLNVIKDIKLVMIVMIILIMPNYFQ